MPQVLIVHGWSDTYESFEPLKDLLVAAGYQTTQVFLGTYASSCGRGSGRTRGSRTSR